MPVSKPKKPEIGVVVIGRNEGVRLKLCLDSIAEHSDYLVYVDSGSTDGSPAMTRNQGVDTIELDSNEPFTAARSRNAGYRHLRYQVKDIKYIQFVDGDCIVERDWLETAARFLTLHEDVAVVCGRLRERFPEKTIYNLICDMEWDLPTGETRSCGGNAFVRVKAFDQCGGFQEDLIAGEEPELCMRLRDSGWKIWRLSQEMALHDADMKKFAQFWTRSVRAGYTFAEGVHRLGRECIKERNRALIWGLCIPVFFIVAPFLLGPIVLLGVLIYPLQILRLAHKVNFGVVNSLVYAFFETLGKFPEMVGILKYYLCLVIGKKSDLIEYK